MNELSSLILTILAGMATLIGYFTIFLNIDENKIINFSLSLASSVMLVISLLDLLPSSYLYLSNYNFFFRLLLLIFFFILGVFTSFYISYKETKKENNSLKKIGIISLIAIILHNIPEGILTILITNVNIKLGINLALAIGMHNIPEGISIAIPYFYATKNKLKTFLLVFLAGFSEVFGAILALLFAKYFFHNFFIGCCLSFIAGIMINISLTKLLPKAISYKKIKITFLGLIIGIFIMLLNHLL